MPNWSALKTEEAAAGLGVDLARGLSEAEAAQKLKIYGPNRLREKKGTPLFLIFFEQFRDLMIAVLLIAALISGFIGEIKDTIMILVIVFLNAVLGTTQQYRAEKAIAALKKLTLPRALVLRGGEIKKIDSSRIVPGDIIFLEAGGFIPADARIIKAPNLLVDESALTGESVPVEKQSEPIRRENVPLAEQSNLVFAGTIATYGRGEALVIATGMQTQIGKIAQMIEEEEAGATPLQRRFSELGRWLAGIALGICGVIFVAGVLREGHAMEMLLTAVSLAVAAIPEGLPAVVTIVLALGAYRMAKVRAVIRKLPAVETLGSTTVICSDKTGTLTQNKMAVQDIFVLQNEDKAKILSAAALCNDATAEVGDPTEKALVIAAQDAGLNKMELDRDFPRLQELPFDSTRKMMSTLHKDHQGFVLYSKGAPEILIEKTNLSAQEKERVLLENKRMVSAGRRVLGLAYRQYLERPHALEEKGLVFLGLIAMSDPPRPEVFKAIELCRQAGIRPIMITGDHELTARAIAEQLGISRAGEELISGSELEKMSVQTLQEKLAQVNVFARVSPEHKLKIVEALKGRGEVVAMTGDGVNDAPALKKADIGIGMGLTGTDVARAASAMVLTDDNFATIVEAVREGRGIYDNIRKFIRYMLSTNAGEIFTMFFSILLRFPLPLLPIHILWVNLVTDGLPAIALSAEPIEEGVMNRPPRRPDESILAEGLLLNIFLIGLLMAGATLGLFAWGVETGGLAKARTLAFTVLALLQMAHVLNCRSLKRSIFKMGILSNAYLFLAIFSTLLLQIAVVYVPFLQSVFRTVPLNFTEWSAVLGLCLLPIALVEGQKLLLSRSK